jgi:hypothetical protein
VHQEPRLLNVLGDKDAPPRQATAFDLFVKVQTLASGAWYPVNSFGASQKLRQQRLGHADGSPVTDTIYTHVISEDGKRIAAQLGNAVWGILDASWTEKDPGVIALRFDSKCRVRPLLRIAGCTDKFAQDPPLGSVNTTRLLEGVPGYRGDLYLATEIEWLTRMVESKAG